LHLIYIYIFSALFQLTKTILIVLDLVSDIFNKSEYFVFESFWFRTLLSVCSSLGSVVMSSQEFYGLLLWAHFEALKLAIT